MLVKEKKAPIISIDQVSKGVDLARCKLCTAVSDNNRSHFSFSQRIYPLIPLIDMKFSTLARQCTILICGLIKPKQVCIVLLCQIAVSY